MESTPIEELSDGRFFTVYVHKIIPSIIPPLEDVKQRVINSWMAEQKQIKNFLETQTLLSDIKSNQTDLKTLNPVSKTLSSIDTAPFGLSQTALDTFFSANEGEIKLATTSDGIVIGYIKSINIEPANSIDTATLKEAKTNIALQSRQDLMSSYVVHLEQERGTQINHELLAQNYGPTDE